MQVLDISGLNIYNQLIKKDWYNSLILDAIEPNYLFWSFGLSLLRFGV